jgi:hypothetical protein
VRLAHYALRALRDQVCGRIQHNAPSPARFGKPRLLTIASVLSFDLSEVNFINLAGELCRRVVSSSEAQVKARQTAALTIVLACVECYDMEN